MNTELEAQPALTPSCVSCSLPECLGLPADPAPEGSAEPAGTLREYIAARPWAAALIGMLGSSGALLAAYACRKPVAAGTYLGVWPGHDFKALLVLSQLIGYVGSKIIAVQVVPRMRGHRRLPAIFGLVSAAILALVLLPLLPAPWNASVMIVNGLSLGMVWGLIFACLEGRRMTDLLTVTLTLALVVTTGVTKGAAISIRQHTGCSELWAPAVTALVFAPMLVGSLWLLTLLPKPTAADRAQTGERRPMSGEDLRAFRRRWGKPLLLLIGVMAMLTVFRDVRDTFMVDVFRENGVSLDFSKLAGIELQVALAAGIPFFALWFVKDNHKAFAICGIVVVLGSLLIGGATLAFGAGLLGVNAWLLLIGIGLCLGYFPFNCLLFDRLFATLRTPGTVTYVMSQAEAWGYMLSCSIVLIKSLGWKFVWTSALANVAYAVALLVPVAMLISMRIFLRPARD